ncbi:MAG TPA: aldehyde dehydrogenase family protein [Planctomycetota bacterium]|nr:aldehyde dehydrogenase family protein [Planctomycetota bacterium]
MSTAAQSQHATTAAAIARQPGLGRFLSAPQRLYIGGTWRTAAGGGTIAVRDPGTGARIADIAAGGAADVEAAVAAAQQAFAGGPWARMPANDRAVILHRLADLIERDADILVALESLDVGKPLAQAAAFDVPHAARTFRWYADLSVQRRRREPIAVSGFDARTVRAPYGACVFIIPWNFPFLLIGWGLAPALAAGNTVVVKPAEDTSLSTLWFCRLAEEAGVPPGVINVVTGLGEEAGAALARHPGIRRMSFTGSPEIGRVVARACGENLVPAKLELGGKGAAVLFEDIDVAATAAALVGAVTLNAGQVCCTATRWLVHRSIWREMVDATSAAMTAVAIGHGADAATQMGPLVSAKQRARVLGYLERGVAHGAREILAGGAATVAGAEDGFYVKPALLTGGADNPCASDEIFGPVAYLMPFEREDEAIALVNRSPYGLANSVWSADLRRAERVGEALAAGNIWINAHNVFAHGIPYGGVNLSGLGGGVLGPETLDDYLRAQSVVRPL